MLYLLVSRLSNPCALIKRGIKSKTKTKLLFMVKSVTEFTVYRRGFKRGWLGFNIWIRKFVVAPACKNLKYSRKELSIDLHTVGNFPNGNAGWQLTHA